MSDGIAIAVLDGADVLRRDDGLAGFVLRPWLLASMDLAIGDQVRALSRQARTRARQAYCAKWHRRFEQLLGQSRLALAHVEEDPDAWAGWACTDSHGVRVHWLYVKSALRGLGLGRRLLHAAAPYANSYTFPAPPALHAVAARYGIEGPRGL